MQHAQIWAGPDPERGPRPPLDPDRDLKASPDRNRIMVIEDDAIVSLATENLLVEAGYAIVALCARGEDAAALAARYRPDLILADVKLAGALDGIGAIAAIRAESGVPVIFVTAHSDAATQARMEALDPIEILAKPVPDFLLLNAVAAALGD